MNFPLAHRKKIPNLREQPGGNLWVNSGLRWVVLFRREFFLAPRCCKRHHGMMSFKKIELLSKLMAGVSVWLLEQPNSMFYDVLGTFGKMVKEGSTLPTLQKQSSQPRHIGATEMDLNPHTSKHKNNPNNSQKALEGQKVPKKNTRKAKQPLKRPSKILNLLKNPLKHLETPWKTFKNTLKTP